MIELRVDRNELRELYALIGRNIAGSGPEERAVETRRATPPPTASPSHVSAEADAATTEDPLAEPERADDAPPFPAFTLAGLRKPLSLAAMELAFGAAARDTEAPLEAQRTMRPREAVSLGPIARAVAPGSIDTGRDERDHALVRPMPVAVAPGVFAALAAASSDTPFSGEARPSEESSTGRETAEAVPPVVAKAEGGTLVRLGLTSVTGLASDPNRLFVGNERMTLAGPITAAAAASAEAGLSSLTGSHPARETVWDSADTSLLRDIDGFLLRAGLGDAAAGPTQIERAGVIASFILNAAMIPGWPPPRPIEPASFARQVPLPAVMPPLESDEMEAGLLLARVLRDPGKVTALLAALATQRRRRKLLALLAILATQTRALLDLWANELGVMPRAETAAPRRERLVLR